MIFVYIHNHLSIPCQLPLVKLHHLWCKVSNSTHLYQIFIVFLPKSKELFKRLCNKKNRKHKIQYVRISHEFYFADWNLFAKHCFSNVIKYYLSFVKNCIFFFSTSNAKNSTNYIYSGRLIPLQKHRTPCTRNCQFVHKQTPIYVMYCSVLLYSFLNCHYCQKSPGTLTANFQFGLFCIFYCIFVIKVNPIDALSKFVNKTRFKYC